MAEIPQTRIFKTSLGLAEQTAGTEAAVETCRSQKKKIDWPVSIVEDDKMMTVIVAVDRSIVRLFFSSMSYSTYSKPNNPSRILCHRKEGVVWTERECASKPKSNAVQCNAMQWRRRNHILCSVREDSVNLPN
ncbi:hypothetical protein T310_0822 [Rasamsonia emersonii CBS 393.64]|uniref:Uncharacterized protein n=1 Tax=Rasamsonia emersonii (strain ATCC 16479 / CBS 393.64 / IMI 116815) TaxID=1408163 RepID=A0A0F4Z3N4_RASE3|nr:hypothetical protein T310_0822 [Rasamsonia emersonii CBS 393.64]KKA25117.1 hypothetical protein T310_0822 [Rasamsonia emersonii CBS 393.64]